MLNVSYFTRFLTFKNDTLLEGVAILLPINYELFTDCLLLSAMLRVLRGIALYLFDPRAIKLSGECRLRQLDKNDFFQCQHDPERPQHTDSGRPPTVTQKAVRYASHLPVRCLSRCLGNTLDCVFERRSAVIHRWHWQHLFASVLQMEGVVERIPRLLHST